MSDHGVAWYRPRPGFPADEQPRPGFPRAGGIICQGCGASDPFTRHPTNHGDGCQVGAAMGRARDAEDEVRRLEAEVGRLQDEVNRLHRLAYVQIPVPKWLQRRRS